MRIPKIITDILSKLTKHPPIIDDTKEHVRTKPEHYKRLKKQSTDPTDSADWHKLY